MTIQELLYYEGKVAVLITSEQQWSRLKELGFRITSKYYGNSGDNCYNNQRSRADQEYYKAERTPVVKFEDIQFEQNYEIY